MKVSVASSERSFTFSINKLRAVKTSLSKTASSSFTRLDSKLKIGIECLGLALTQASARKEAMQARTSLSVRFVWFLSKANNVDCSTAVYCEVRHSKGGAPSESLSSPLFYYINKPIADSSD